MTPRSGDRPVAAAPDGVLLAVRVVPRSSRNQVVGSDGDAIKIRLTAPPVEGAANAALIACVAEWLKVRSRAVSIVSGDKARRKRVHVQGVSVAEVEARLAQADSAPATRERS